MRGRLGLALLCLGWLACLACGQAWTSAASAADAPVWRRGIEGQRIADLGDGTFLNPVLAGDRPDPSIIRVGRDFYLTLSSFDAYPGLPIWHSRDLVNWRPIGHAVSSPVGSIWAPELVKHGERNFIYFHARNAASRDLYVIWSDDMRGPWSTPRALGLPKHIDPGHAVGEDGRRYLFLSGGDRVALSDDGLQVIGDVEHVYDGWRYPDDWVVESYSLEGPKLLRRDGWFYLVTAVGGTAGPPTGHMVIAARSRSIHGPWMQAPHNPLVRTRSRDERWWSRGHATLIDDIDGRWWMVHHGYENGFWTLGRQMLLDAVVWRDDGWFEAVCGDLGRPLRKPAGDAGAGHGMALSDTFEGPTLGPQWQFHAPAEDERARVSFENGAMVLRAKGDAPRNASPLAVIAGDHRYRVEVAMDIAPGAVGGLLVFYSDRLYAGLGSNGEAFVLHRYGEERPAALPPGPGGRLWIRLTNDRHEITLHTSRDGLHWEKYGVQMEVSGYHHNTAGRFLSLRPALYASGQAAVRFLDFRYESLE